MRLSSRHLTRRTHRAASLCALFGLSLVGPAVAAEAQAASTSSGQAAASSSPSGLRDTSTRGAQKGADAASDSATPATGRPGVRVYDTAWVAKPFRAAWLDPQPSAAVRAFVRATIQPWEAATGHRVEWQEPRKGEPVVADVLVQLRPASKLGGPWHGQVRIHRREDGVIQFAELRLPADLDHHLKQNATRVAMTALVLHEWGHVLDLSDDPSAPGTVLHPSAGPAVLTDADRAVLCTRYGAVLRPCREVVSSQAPPPGRRQP